MCCCFDGTYIPYFLCFSTRQLRPYFQLPEHIRETLQPTVNYIITTSINSTFCTFPMAFLVMIEKKIAPAAHSSLTFASFGAPVNDGPFRGNITPARGGLLLYDLRIFPSLFTMGAVYSGKTWVFAQVILPEPIGAHTLSADGPSLELHKFSPSYTSIAHVQHVFTIIILIDFVLSVNVVLFCA